MKKWVEKDQNQWFYFDDDDGKIIGMVHKIGTQTTAIWNAKIYAEIEGSLGQYVDSDYARRAVENYWEIQSRTLIE